MKSQVEGFMKKFGMQADVVVKQVGGILTRVGGSKDWNF